MGLRQATAIAACLLAGIVAVAPASAQSDTSSRWYFDAEALFLKRDRGDDVVLGQEFSASTGALVNQISSHSVRYDFEPGARIRLGYRFSDDAALDLTYFGLNEWQESTALGNSNPAGPNQMTSPGLIATPNFARVDSIVARMSSDINNIELNLRQRLNSGRTRLTTGIRYLRFDDDLVIRADGIGFSAASEFDQSVVMARNELLGAQLGLDHTFGEERFTVQLFGSAGIYHNWNEQSVREVNSGNFGGVFANVEGEDTRATGIFELGLSASYRPRKNVSVIGGYQLMSLHGIALAPKQLDFVSANSNTATPVTNLSAGTRDSSDLLFQGLHVGLRIDWR